MDKIVYGFSVDFYDNETGEFSYTGDTIIIGSYADAKKEASEHIDLDYDYTVFLHRIVIDDSGDIIQDDIIDWGDEN